MPSPGLPSRRTVLLAAPALVLAVVLGVFFASTAGNGGRSAAPRPEPEGGTAADPQVVEADTSLMQWVEAPGSPDNTVTTNGSWFLTVGASGTEYALDGAQQSFGSDDPINGRITNALLNADWAVVVRHARDEKKPDVAEVTRLSIGQQFTIDGDTDVPTTNGGTWALSGDTLVHATVTGSGDYCLASVDLVEQQTTVGWCTGPQQGFTTAHVTEAGTTLLTFDDSQPVCRTVGLVDGDELTPFEGVPECEGFDHAVMGEDGQVWSTVPQNAPEDTAEFFAREGDSWYDLGRGTSGTLVPCGDAAYFARDPQKEGAPAQLVRWQDRTLTVVYEAPPGQSYLEAPRCGDDALVVTALREAGNEQVMAALE